MPEIIKQPNTESGLNKQLLENFQTENSCYHKCSRLEWKIDVYYNDEIGKIY